MTTTTDLATQGDFALTLGRGIIDEAGEHDGLVHVWWRDKSNDDSRVQVYVNGALTNVTTDANQRDLWLIVDRSRPTRIELLKVFVDDAERLWQPRPEQLRGWTPAFKDLAGVSVLRDESLPVDTQIEVSVDGQRTAAGELWPRDTPRSGFGGLFGLGTFGQDAASGWGLGRGELGFGPLGTDGTAWRWQTRDLPSSHYTIALTATDATGQTISAPVMLPDLEVESLPNAAGTLEMQPDFTLAWTD